ALALVVVAGGYVMLGKPETTAGEPVVTTSAETATKRTDTAAAEPAKVETAAVTADPKPQEPAPPVASNTEAATIPSATGTADAVPAAGDAVADSDPAEAAEGEVIATEAAETKPADAVAKPDPAATAEAEPKTDAAPTDADTAAGATETAASAEPAAETAADIEPAAEAASASGVKLAANQVGFAAWDVLMPFSYDERMLGGKRAAVVTRFQPGVDVTAAGDWLAPGVSIHSVNGIPIQSAGSLTVAVMNAMAVDPDGKARVVVEYTDRTQKAKTGLLTVGAVRLTTLANGVALRTAFVDGVWKTDVTAVAKPEVTTLKPGDTLFRDKTTTSPLDGPTSVEKILATLVQQGVAETEFSIIRDNKVESATMQLVQDRAQ
ncbi:MAG TPA: hypothetical protein VK146_05290, partial [Tabrizicola sp.]|nr:hypothetical protein [Tabrizicola sp.]